MATSAAASPATAAAASTSASGRTAPLSLRIDPGSSSTRQPQQQLATRNESDYDDWDTESCKNVDPLELYHRHQLDSNPHLTESIASDDDLLDLLRTTRDRAQLKWLEDSGLPLAPHPVPITYPAWKAGRGNGNNASVLSFESPTSASAGATPTSSSSSSARYSPEGYWRSSSDSGFTHSDQHSSASASSSIGGSQGTSLATQDVGSSIFSGSGASGSTAGSSLLDSWHSSIGGGSSLKR
ncbi:hypothetical protein OC835_006745 [Tilletia horrida]|nr:hypothetical protein OC835_006745 [Tilletia horrida]KAK0556712.1 hypothetical protein OC844_005780 [Tilletia horrida]